MEQLIILLVVGGIALAKWAIEKAMQGGGDAPPPPSPRRTISSPAKRADSETSDEEERMRKFMEALGIPQGSSPPQPRRRSVARRSPANPLGIPEVPPPGQPVRSEVTSYGRRPEIPPPIPTPAAPPRPVVVTIPVPPGATEVRAILPAPELGRPSIPASVETPFAANTLGSLDLHTLLRSRDSIRAAMLVREILGPPRGLQSPF